MNELTPVAVKILGVFKYFKVKKNGLLSTKLLLSKAGLWRDVDEITYERAVDELLEKEFIRESMGEKPGYMLTESGADYLKSPT
jgi:predicted transcriptional regulator